MAEKKKKKNDGWAGWSKPVVKGRSKRKPTARKPASQSSSQVLAAYSEWQRRDMSETRRRQQAARPTLTQKRKIQQRDKEMRQDSKLNSPAAKRARDRIKFQGR